MRTWNLILCLLLGTLINVIQAAKVDSLLVYSNSMDKKVKVMTILPDKAVKGEECPVVYLLHGCGNDGKHWLFVKPNLPEIADRDGIIFVCPDAEQSWYWDSPIDNRFRYETFVSKELISYIDRHFPTKANRNQRAVCGFSMGGHGALWLAIRHKDVFGVTGSMSGGLDIRPFPEEWNMKNMLGERDSNLDVWNNHTVINLLDRLKNGELAIIIDCGTSDFFYGVNKAVHDQLLIRKIDHDFITRPGNHNYMYWRKSIDFQILFFKNFFEREINSTN